MTTTVLDAVAAIDRLAGYVDLDENGRLTVDTGLPIDWWTAVLIRRHRRALAFTVAARSTGHEWLVCDRCGEPQLLMKEKAGRRCQMTAGCKGKVARIPDHNQQPQPRRT